jgi:hypothetical protein
MASTAQALRVVAGWIGLEGVLLIVGTVALASAAAWFHPVGALVIVGVVTLSLGFAVALRGA